MEQTAQLDPRALIRFVHAVFGTIQHAPIQSQILEQKVRAKYQPLIDQLTRLGFTYVCADGESFPLWRLLLVLPAITMIGIALFQTPVALTTQSILAAYPLLVMKARATFANIDGDHVKFFTAFRDGSLLVSGNYDDQVPRGPGTIRYFQKATITETWTKHLARIDAMELGGNQINPRSGYEAYVEVSERDTAAW